MSDADVLVVLGTRPEIIKLGPVINLLGERAQVIHTGQHYDARLSQAFFEAFDLSPPEIVLEIGGDSRGNQIGKAVSKLSDLLESSAFKAVVIQGDTNSAVAGAIAANATETLAVHVEAGLRSFDRRMPEEHNRVVADHLCDLLCAPTSTAVENLLSEAIAPDRISLTGNTIVEAVQFLLPAEEERRRLLTEHDLEPGKFVIATFHRPENVDDAARFGTVLESLAKLQLPVVLPLHPRAARRVEEFGLGSVVGTIRTTPPLGYRAFLGLALESAFLVSDSGGIQEEASVLKRPVIVVRRSTERPEVQGTFARLVEPEGILEATENWLHEPGTVHKELATLETPYGDGRASERITKELIRVIG